MTLEILGLLAFVALLLVFLVYTLAGRLRPAKALQADALSFQPPTASQGLMKAAKVFFWIGLGVGVIGFFVIPGIGIFGASGPWTLAFVLYVIALCMR